MAPTPPFRSVVEELLFAILQKLPDAQYLTRQDIDSLAKLNVLLLDADLAPAGETQAAIESIKGNVPAIADTLEKMYGIIQGLTFLKTEDIDTLAELNSVLTDADLLRGGDIKFPNVLFVSPDGDNNHGLKGDISRPFAPDGIASRAGAGDKVMFLPGDYTVNTNLAVNGVEYGTLGGGVQISVSQAGAILFDYTAIANSNLPVKIAGEFDFKIDANTAGIFKFNKPGQSARQYSIRWRTALQLKGTFLTMPLLLTIGTFEGCVEIAPSADQPCIVCDGNGSTGNGVVKLAINNNSTTTSAISPCFNGFSFDVNYNATAHGLFKEPVTNNSTFVNSYKLKIAQPAGATTYITSGNYELSLVGGTVVVVLGSKVVLSGFLRTCTFNAGPSTDTFAQCVANTVAILNAQVTLLVLDGVWRNCTYNRTSSNPVVLKGDFFNFTFLGSPSLMTITGRVELTEGNYIFGEGGQYFDLQGTLIGNAPTLFIFGFNYKVLISGRLKNLKSDGKLFETNHNNQVYTLILTGAVLEAGASAPHAINIFIEDTINITLYGKSFINKPVLGPGTVNYIVGPASDLVISGDVRVYP
ncbi:hypothetical protein [Dawidia soli]|uniref:Uncharacterized protein n=1 Tax=Dawidia soli TaxID=2782352 RepID=A0AAP2DBC2_9BACT|nr:hypothetical protein [Dawidia soli]MBT1688878.1 hypothetical protein [Dawidia soli]